MEDYLQRYGYRSLDELKLEVPDLREDPSSVFVMLRSALARNAESAAPPDPGTRSDPAMRSLGPPPESAQQYLDATCTDYVAGHMTRCAASCLGAPRIVSVCDSLAQGLSAWSNG